MITRFGMAPRLSEASVEEFQEHWRTSHADAAGQIPNLRRYTQNHGFLRDGRYLLGYPGFDACSELDFDSVASMEDGFASDTYQQMVRADERAFVEKSRFSMMIGRRLEVKPGEGEVKLLTFMRSHPSSDVDELVAALTGPYAASLADHVAGHLVYKVDLEGHASIPAAFDVVDVLWLDSKALLNALLASGTWARATWELSGRASGLTRLAARPVEVV